MNKFIVGLLSVSMVSMAGCALDAGEGEDSVSSLDQALKAVIFRGSGNTGYSNESDKTATITASSTRHVKAKASLAISLSIDDSAPFDAASIRRADCPNHTISVTYKQPDIQEFTTTSPAAAVRNGRCTASIALEWNPLNPPGTFRLLPPSTAASQQRVTLSGMPVTPAVGNVTVVTKTSGVANTDKYSFRVNP